MTAGTGKYWHFRLVLSIFVKPTSYRNWFVEVNLGFHQIFSNTDIAIKIHTLIKLKVKAGQRQHYIVGVTMSL